MPGLFDVGKSALQSYRQQLAVTGQNIANINTDGYKRREAALEEISGSQGGITSISNQAGLGVRVQEIRRAFDAYVIDRSRSASANFEASDALLNKLSELEDIILPQDSNLGIFIGHFFNSLQEVAASPGDISPRVVAIETGKSLAESFKQTSSVVSQLQDGVFKQTEQSVSAANVLLNELTQINAALMSSGQTGSAANSLLDTRDRVIDEISKFVEITTELDSRGAASLRLGNSGNGPLVVDNERVIPLSVAQNFDGLQFSLYSEGNYAPTSQVINGSLKGLSDSYTLIKKTYSDIDEMAFAFATQVNQQHKLGLDLNNESGKDLFSSGGFTITQNPTNITNISAEAIITDLAAVSPKPISIVYDKEANLWRAFDENKLPISSGKNSLLFSGFEVKVSGNASNGDEFYVSPSAGYSKNLEFIVTKPESIAAASRKMIYADNANSSTADITAKKIQSDYNINIPKISDVLTNSLSAISASEFYKAGAIGYVPKNASAIELVSLEQQPQIKFSLTDAQLRNASTLSFSTATPNNKTYQFNIGYSNVFQGETGNWIDSSQIAKYLNQGILTTTPDSDGISVAASLSSAGNLTLGGALTSSGTATFTDARTISISSTGNDTSRSFTIIGTDANGNAQTEQVKGTNASTNFSTKLFKTVTSVTSDGSSGGNVSVGVLGIRLSDLGGYASGNSGNLSLALSEGTLSATPPQIVSSGSAVTGSILSRSSASNIQVFTKEGRHIAGTPLTENEINSLLTSANGFESYSEYRADYLNGYGENGYRGINIERTNKTADSVITIGADGGSARAFSGISLLPDSPTEPWSLKVGGIKNIDVPAGSSAGYAASVINRNSSDYGIIATATSRVELSNTGQSGILKFKLASKDTTTVDIEARVSSTSMSTLAEKINLFSDKSGVTATTSKDQTRLVLESKDGSDINITGFDFDGNTGKTITATVIDQFSKATSSSVKLGGNQDDVKFTLSDSQIAKASTLSFTIDSTLYNFDISYLSAFGTAGEWTDISEIAKYLNRGTLLSGATKLSDLGIYAEGAFGDLSLRLNEKEFTSNSGGISASATLGAAGNLVLGGPLTSGGSATLATAKAITILSEGNDSGRTFTITGTDASNNSQTETITGANAGKAIGTKLFKSISSIASDGATAGNVSVGLKQIAPVLTSTGLTDSVGAIAGSKKVGTAKFSGTLELVSPESFNVTIDSKNVSSATDHRQNTLITQTPSKTGDTTSLFFNALDGIDSNGSDKDGILANAAAGSYTVSLPNTGTGSTFTATVKSSEVNPVTPTKVASKMTEKLRALAPSASLSGAIALAALPEDQDSIVIAYDKQYYTLQVSYKDPKTKENPEISISGGEPGRLTAYFDSNKKLQISAPHGTLSGAQFDIIGNSIIAGNESASKRFGLTSDAATADRALTGRTITLSNSTKTLGVTLNGASINITMTPNGSGTYTLSTSNANINATFSDTGTTSTTATSSKIILTTKETSGTLVIPSTTNAENFFGFKVSNYSITQSSDTLNIASTNDKVVSVTTSATSIADQRVKLTNLPSEDLIVLVSGNGANRITANYDINPEPYLLSEPDLTVKIIDDSGSIVEVLDTQTGHSIATRSLDPNRATEAVGYSIQLSSKANKNDLFHIQDNKSAAGDARNIDEILKLQKPTDIGKNQGNFQEIFSSIVSRVGSSVHGSELKQKSAEALRDTAAEFESQFSGVNLDEEAANLIEQQQAYQASARILSTARELFDTLLESV